MRIARRKIQARETDRQRETGTGGRRVGDLPPGHQVPQVCWPHLSLTNQRASITPAAADWLIVGALRRADESPGKIMREAGGEGVRGWRRRKLRGREERR